MFKPVKIEEIPEPHMDNSPAVDVKRFLKSGFDSAEIELSPNYKANFTKAMTAYSIAARRIGGCRAIQRQKRIFLVREGSKFV